MAAAKAFGGLGMDEKCFVECAKADFAVLARKLPVLIGLLLLPCLIFLLYVGSYYNPLVNVADTEILLCNLDGSEFSGQVQDAIMATNLFKFRVSNYDAALESVRSGKSWGLIVIPSDFSSRFEDNEGPEIRIILDDQQSYIVARVLASSFEVLGDRLNANLAAQYNGRIAEGLATASSQSQLSSTQLGTLSDASSQLSSSSAQVALGTGTISSYMSELSLSEGKIATGLKQASYSSGVLSSSLSQLSAASTTLQTSTGSLSTATGQIITSNTAEQAYLLSAINSTKALSDSAEKNATLLALQNAYNLSVAQGNGLATAKAGMATLYSSQGVLSSKLGSASTGANDLSNSLYKAYLSQSKASSQTGQASSALSTASGASSRIASGEGKVSTAADMLSQKDATLAGKLGDASNAAASAPTVTFQVNESNSVDNYGTFFATVFIILGLFLGSVSAYVLCSLEKLRRPFNACTIVIVLQCALLLALYISMGFPTRGGADSLFAVMLLSGLLFALLVRAFCKALAPKINASHLQIISPAMTLLAVFMLSSGGVIWPQHTLEWPFSIFAPYIPFNYAVNAIRVSALGGDLPLSDVAALFVFAAAFIVLAKAFEEKAAIAAAIRKVQLSI